jgi:hypothetical protein
VTAGPVSPPFDSSRADITAAVRCRVLGDMMGAKRLLVHAVLAGRPGDPLARWAAELVALYAVTRDPELRDLCRCACSLGRNVRPAFALAEGKILLLDGEQAQARTRLNEVTTSFPGSEYARTAALDLCFCTVCEPGAEGAGEFLLNLSARPETEDAAVRAALWISQRLCRDHRPASFTRTSPGDAAVHGGDLPSLGSYPNPFNPVTTIEYRLPGRTQVVLAVYDIRGRHVATLADGLEEAGRHTFRFDGSGLSSGVYICRLAAGGHDRALKLVLVR